MNTPELELILKTANDLGYNSLGLAIDDSADGNTEYVNAKAKIVKDKCGKILLVFSYE